MTASTLTRDVQSFTTYSTDRASAPNWFVVTYGRHTTTELPGDVSSDHFRTAMEGLSGVGKVGVFKVVLDETSTKWLVTFR